MCHGDADGPECFTKAQTQAIKKIYEGIKNSKGNLLFPGQPPGAEILIEAPSVFGGKGLMSGWAPSIIGSPKAKFLFPDIPDNISLGIYDTAKFMKYMAFEKDNPDYDWKTFNFDTDPQKLTYMKSILDAAYPDLSEFNAKGGKIIQYQGWADTLSNPNMSINYYKEALNLMGEQTKKFYRLYMAPGMFHCGDGVGCDEVDWFTPLVNWVEKGIEPEELIGSHSTEGKTDRTRPICPYPGVSKYKGTGDINNAANFICFEP